MSLPLYDAHNHAQDERLAACQPPVLDTARAEGIKSMVVNGTQESDWPRVLQLARENPQAPRLIPCFGLHPWHVPSRSPDWRASLLFHLDQTKAGIGEIGLDRWIQNYDLADQEDVFLWQWRTAAERDLPVSVHCLKAWGRLLELLQREPAPQRGFLLHSYGGPRELIPALTRLGAYFSVSGYFAHDRKAKQREVLRGIPPDRLLLETDAPDMLPPDSCIRYPSFSTNPKTAIHLEKASGQPINHPGNLGMIYQWAADLFQEPLEPFALRLERNFQRLFGALA